MVHDFLLDWVPRKIDVADEDVAHVPEAVAEVLGFLGATGRLPTRRADALARRALVLGPEFEWAAPDPGRFGLAKGLSPAMMADGVDLSDEAAVQAWIDGFNALSREEREELVPALTSLPAPPQPERGAKRKRATKARKAQKQARRRSRRRR